MVLPGSGGKATKLELVYANVILLEFVLNFIKPDVHMLPTLYNVHTHIRTP